MSLNAINPISLGKTLRTNRFSYNLTYITSRKNSFFHVKRVVDFTLSFVVSAFILTWLIPIIALLIKLDSRGSVFFIQKRVGFQGKIFGCIKFRTMIPNIHADSKQAVENDYRITRVGAFLRKTNLDEFPQFINVLLGHMSIIGPRPHMPSDCKHFEALIPEYDIRHIIKPGITGLAQIKGFRGPSNDFTSAMRRFQFDTFYIRHSNAWLDLRILRITASQTFTLLASKMRLKRLATHAHVEDFENKVAA